MIEVRNLSFDYGEGGFSLRLPELTVDDGASVAFVGPSGSGKTTLLNLVSGVLLPREGRIRIDGTNISDLGERQRREFRLSKIGLVFQEFELLEYLNVLDNILLPYRLDASLPLTANDRQRAERIAEDVGIKDELARYPDQLSQGERQRVAVCRAIVTEPALLLADEPTGNLDPANKDKVLDILFAYQNETGSTLVAVTHDHDVLHRFDRVVDLKDFHVTGSPETAGAEAS